MYSMVSFLGHLNLNEKKRCLKVNILNKICNAVKTTFFFIFIVGLYKLSLRCV